MQSVNDPTPTSAKSRRASSLDQDERRRNARQLAASHRPCPAASCKPLLRRMEAETRALDDAMRLIADEEPGSRLRNEAVEWLLDNEPLVRSQLQSVRRNLVRRPCLRLPSIIDEPLGTVPRVYALACELAAHLDRPLSREGIEEFVAVYQEDEALLMAELWSLPDMLRLALAAMFQRIAAQVAHSASVKRAMLKGIRNVVLSLRAIEEVSWKDIIESQSAVERILGDDPAEVYPRMDFESRDWCRRAVERIARRTALSEAEVAKASCALARQAQDSKRRHVGYYLVDSGRALLEHRVSYRPTLYDRAARIIAQVPLAVYLGAIAAVWLLGIAGAVVAARHFGIETLAHAAACALLLLSFGIASSQFAVNIVNWFYGILLRPKPLMRMDYAGGIPADCRCLVAVPAMLSSPKAIGTLLRQLEIRYLANRDANLLFALVTDFPDADCETLPGDRNLLSLARSGVKRLNDRYCRDCPSAFYLLHRKRKWNPQEGVWMGEERKRGKLMDLNRLLCTGARDAFRVIRGDLERLSSVRYVITLDADTMLPPDAGRGLVACMAHPLNGPRLDPATRLVVEGHAVLQPRITVTIPSAHRSLFSRLLAGDAGTDPYTHQSANLYQDAFGQGSYIGKGIYDVRAFEAALDGRFPDNRILSHDLIEGCFTRSGVASDVELLEGVPSRLPADMSRRHRWIRGDWQIASWMFPRVPSLRGAAANPLAALARWKIVDNIRRSIAPIFLALFLLGGWSLVPALAGLWALLSAGLLFGPVLLGSLVGFLRRPDEKPYLLHLRDQGRSLLHGLCVEGLGWCVLPYTVHCHLDAIARALYRTCLSRRKLLEWTTASDAEARSGGSCRDYYELMWSCAVSSMAMAAWLTVAAPWALCYAAPALVGWLLGPAIAWRISEPGATNTPALGEAERRQTGRWARQTWHYFESHVNEHGLPPDHVQEHPRPAIARLTSPTNIGMGLLADLAACDLGYLSPGGLLERTGRTLQTLLRLEKHRGHFYNWYDIDTLQVVVPRYISSVDSGNLWGAMLTLRYGLEELRDRPLVPSRLLAGLQDTLAVIASLPAITSAPASRGDLEHCLDSLCAECLEPPVGARQWLGRLHRIRALAAELSTRVPPRDRTLKRWTLAPQRQCAAAHRELSALVFWRYPRRGAGKTLQRVLAPMQDWLEQLDRGCTLGELLPAAKKMTERIDRILAAVDKAADKGRRLQKARDVLERLRGAAEQAAATVRRQLLEISALSDACKRICAMDFQFLFHGSRKLLTVGYDVARQRCDGSRYDLLASEARLTSFLAISHGQLPREHWAALGRPVTAVGGRPALLSWSGSMFEYLMPLLLMPTYPATILAATCRAAVRAQIDYGRRQGIPWGISESCHHRIDANLRYRYRAFGVPGLGLSPDLDEHLVVAPYASALALLIAPREAATNLAEIERLGGLSACGFYDAIDYTSAGPLAKAAPALCRVVMAHHSGMALLAMVDGLLPGTMQRRFMADPRCEAYDALLQQRVPHAIRLADRPFATRRRPTHRDSATAHLSSPAAKASHVETGVLSTSS